jgi:hypothetical protein
MECTLQGPFSAHVLACCGMFSSSLAAGCAFHGAGLVHPGDNGTTLNEMDGKEIALRLDEDSAPLGFLDGHSVDIEGRRFGGRVHVTSWTVLDGLHGMPVWVGQVMRAGSGIGVDDRNSGVFHYVDEDAAVTLAPWIGRMVLVEGYIDGPHKIHATSWRPLADPPSSMTTSDIR